MLKQRGNPEGESRYSWTVDFAARRAKAREKMQPLLEEASEVKATVMELKERRYYTKPSEKKRLKGKKR